MLYANLESDLQTKVLMRTCEVNRGKKFATSKKGVGDPAAGPRGGTSIGNVSKEKYCKIAGSCGQAQPPTTAKTWSAKAAGGGLKRCIWPRRVYEK